MPGSKSLFAACALLTLILVSPVCAQTTAFINVNVVSMTSERVDSAQTVLVENGRISIIGPVDKTPLPKDIEIIDGTDRYLMPGLAEMHAHVPDVASQELGRVMTLFAANGVTTIRGMLGRPSHLQLREDLLQEKVSAQG